MKPELELVLEESVQDSMGVYPAQWGDKKRTEWQEGWNAYGMELLKRSSAVHDWHESIEEPKRQMIDEMLLAGAVFVRFKDDQPVVYFMTSDLFAWGHADWDEVTDDMLTPLHEAWKKHGIEGMLAWWCKRENQKPQWPVEESWRLGGIWDAELEALPECKYDEAIGRWKDCSKADAIANLARAQQEAP